MKTKIVLFAIVAATMAVSCKKSAPVETTTQKQTYTIRVYNTENDKYSNVVFIKL